MKTIPAILTAMTVLLIAGCNEKPGSVKPTGSTSAQPAKPTKPTKPNNPPVGPGDDGTLPSGDGQDGNQGRTDIPEIGSVKNPLIQEVYKAIYEQSGVNIEQGFWFPIGCQSGALSSDFAGHGVQFTFKQIKVGVEFFEGAATLRFATDNYQDPNGGVTTVKAEEISMLLEPTIRYEMNYKGPRKFSDSQVAEVVDRTEYLSLYLNRKTGKFWRVNWWIKNGWILENSLSCGRLMRDLM